MADVLGVAKTKVDLYSFGNGTQPRASRIKGYNTKPALKADLKLNCDGLVQSGLEGASTFASLKNARIKGLTYKLPPDTELPGGID